jgi:putative PIN family toxin of toxin-antitoxin system
MRVVVDSNIIFSALLLKNSRLRELLFRKNHRFYCPNYVFVEIFKYKEKIIKYSQLNEIELYEYLNKILENIKSIKKEVISKENRLAAFNLCEDVDEKDAPFIALAIEVDAFMWTGDKTLKRALGKKGFDRFTDLESLDSSII